MTQDERDMHAEWLIHPCTVQLLEKLDIDISGIKESWANGDFLVQTEQKNNRSAGVLEAAEMFVEAIETGSFIYSEEEQYDY